MNNLIPLSHQLLLVLRMDPVFQTQQIIKSFSTKNISDIVLSFKRLKSLLTDDASYAEYFMSSNGLKDLIAMSKNLANNNEESILNELIIELLSSLILYVSTMDIIKTEPDVQKWLVSIIDDKFPPSLINETMKILLVFCEVTNSSRTVVSNTRDLDLFKRLASALKKSLTEFKLMDSAYDEDLSTIALRLLNKLMIGEYPSHFDKMTTILEEGEVALTLRDLMRKKSSEVFKEHARFFDVIENFPGACYMLLLISLHPSYFACRLGNRMGRALDCQQINLKCGLIGLF